MNLEKTLEEIEHLEKTVANFFGSNNILGYNLIDYTDYFWTDFNKESMTIGWSESMVDGEDIDNMMDGEIDIHRSGCWKKDGYMLVIGGDGCGNKDAYIFKLENKVNGG